MAKTPRYVSREKFAGMIGASLVTVARYLREGVIPLTATVKLARRRLIDADVALDIIKARTAKRPPPSAGIPLDIALTMFDFEPPRENGRKPRKQVKLRKDGVTMYVKK